jgi:6-phosphogluconolactonase
VGTNGALRPAVDLKQHNGSGPNKERQEAAHAHSVVLDRNNRFAFVNDLGTDKIAIYKFDSDTGKLDANEAQPFYASKPGAGPRHFKFHPNGRFAFAINELDMTVSSLAYDERRGTLSEIATVPTIPAGFSGENTCADLHVSPNGAFLYGSNRGHDSLVAYRIDANSGKLEFIEHESTGGRTPRNFVIDPTGTYLLAANQRSGNIVTFKIDAKSGRLETIGKPVTVPAPVCLKLIPAFG